MAIANFQRVHFIGIGGIGMSALARYCLAVGKKVSGSDAVTSELTRDLDREGIRIHIGHTGKNVPPRTDLVVMSNAISSNNPELQEAKKLNLPVWTYSQFLGALTREKYTIAVAGTHGKSTTTAMIALVLLAGGLDPTVIVGTKLKEFDNSNFRLGKSNFLVIEADEYKRAFLQYHPHIAVFTNIDLDHLDYFKHEEDYIRAFRQFTKSIPHTGFLVANEGEKNVQLVKKSLKGNFIPVLFQQEKFRIRDNAYPYPKVQVPGTHNRHNAALALAVGKILNIPKKTIYQALEKFTGTWRRFERKGELPTGALCFDDYGHHPTEIRATLQGTRELFPRKRIICVFQPHQYSRTHKLLSDFATAFTAADIVVIPNIYAARDTAADKQKISVDVLVEAIRKEGKRQVLNGKNLEKTAQWLQGNTTKNDVVLTMGAGDITTIYTSLKLRSTKN